MIDAGYAAMHEALDKVGDALMSGGGVHPQREVELSIDRQACIGCTICATAAPHLIRMTADGKAEMVRQRVVWSRADGEFVHRCPTQAIKVVAVDGENRHNTMEYRRLPDTEEEALPDR
jgi:ferredoxin